MSGAARAATLACVGVLFFAASSQKATATNQFIYVQDCFFATSSSANTACASIGPSMGTKQITAGDTVYWYWNGTAQTHSVISQDGAFTNICPGGCSGFGYLGGQTGVTFYYTGSHYFYCGIHLAPMDGTIQVNPGPESYYTLTPSTYTPTAGSTFTITTRAYDVYGNFASGQFAYMDESFDGGSNYAYYGYYMNSNGIVAVTIPAYTTAGSHTIYMRDYYNHAVYGAVTVNVQPAYPTHFTLTPSTSTPNAGAAFTETVNAYDQYNNFASNYSDYLARSYDGGLYNYYGDYLSNGSLAVPISAGTFTSSGSHTVDIAYYYNHAIFGSNAVTVQPLSANQLTVAASTPVTAGGNTSVTVTAKDIYGNRDTNDNDAITYVTSDPQNASVHGASLSTGQVSFSTPLYTVGTRYVNATDSGHSIGSTQSNAVTVNPGVKV